MAGKKNETEVDDGGFTRVQLHLESDLMYSFRRAGELSRSGKHAETMRVLLALSDCVIDTLEEGKTELNLSLVHKICFPKIKKNKKG